MRSIETGPGKRAGRRAFRSELFDTTKSEIDVFNNLVFCFWSLIFFLVLFLVWIVGHIDFTGERLKVRGQCDANMRCILKARGFRCSTNQLPDTFTNI